MHGIAYKGFYEPSTNEILPSAVPIHCLSFRPIPLILDNQTFVFERNGSIIPVDVVHDLPTSFLTVPDISKLMPTTYFHRVVMYSRADFSPPVTTNDLIHTLKIQSEILRHLGLKGTETDTHAASVTFLESLTKHTHIGVQT